MKANEASEKLYLCDTGILGDGVSTGKLKETDIEYTRTDAFIEKLECWMNENFYQYAGEFAEGILGQFDRTEDAIDSFRKYIKGE